MPVNSFAGIEWTDEHPMEVLEDLGRILYGMWESCIKYRVELWVLHLLDSNSFSFGASKETMCLV